MYRLIYRAMIKSLRPTLCVRGCWPWEYTKSEAPSSSSPCYKLKFILRGRPAR